MNKHLNNIYYAYKFVENKLKRDFSIVAQEAISLIYQNLKDRFFNFHTKNLIYYLKYNSNSFIFTDKEIEKYFKEVFFNKKSEYFHFYLSNLKNKIKKSSFDLSDLEELIKPSTKNKLDVYQIDTYIISILSWFEEIEKKLKDILKDKISTFIILSKSYNPIDFIEVDFNFDEIEEISKYYYLLREAINGCIERLIENKSVLSLNGNFSNERHALLAQFLFAYKALNKENKNLSDKIIIKSVKKYFEYMEKREIEKIKDFINKFNNY